jgi:glutathione synthase
MRILAIIDPPQTLDPQSDTTVAILEEAQQRGHQIAICELHDLWLRGSVAGADVRAVTAIRRDRRPALSVDEQRLPRPLEDFHVVLMRKDPPYDINYHLATLILEYGRGKTLLVNDPRGLREANEKLYIFHFPDLIAPTVVTHRMDELRAFMATHDGQMVVKPLDGHGGSSVFHVRSDDRNASTILEVMTNSGQRWVMAQKYLDIVRTGDKRILILGGEPIGAVLRMPQSTELRSNLHIGGTAVRTELTDRDREICARIKPRLLQDGLHFVGIDVIDGHLTEVNVTSPTCVQAIDRLQEIRLEAKIVDFLEQHAPHSN